MPAWLPAVVFVHALAEDGTSSMAMARRTGRPDREHSALPSSTLLLHHRLAAASRVTILLCIPCMSCVVDSDSVGSEVR